MVLMLLFNIAKKQSMYKRKKINRKRMVFFYRCRHLVICNYFGDMLLKACETMCDVCTQRELVSANLQNLKVKFEDFNYKYKNSYFRKKNSMKSIIDVLQIVFYIVMKVLKNSMKVVE